MNKNKGFTLVELLAVIAILAILVLIALPNIMGMFNQAKENSFKTELKVIYKIAGQTWIKDSMLDTKEITYSRCDNCLGVELDLSGRTEIKYCIKLDKAGKVKEYYASDGTFSYSYTGGDLKVEEIKDVQRVEDGKIISCDGLATPLPVGDSTLGYYFNPYKNEYYDNLRDAFNDVQNNQTIVLLKGLSKADPTASLSNDKTGIKLDLNGYYLNEYHQIRNNGELEIYNGSNNQGKLGYGIDNYGVLTINGTKKIAIEKLSNGGGIVNKSSGTLTIKGNVEINDSYGNGVPITNSGNVTITNAIVNVEGNGAIANNETGIMNLYDSQITSTSSDADAITNSGTLTISGGTITGSIGLNNTQNATISNCTITGNLGLKSTGEITITNSTITGTESTGISNNGIMILNSNTISGEKTGFQNNQYGTSTINGGTITGKKIGIVAFGVITIGSNDSNIDTNSPLIQTLSTSEYGIKVNTRTVVNFYDGIIKSAAGTGKSISGTISSIPNGYQIHKETVSGVESAYLVRQ